MKLSVLTEKRKLKNTDLTKNVSDWNTSPELKLKDKKERLSLKLLDLNKRRESKLIVKSKSLGDLRSKSSKNNRNL